MHHTIWIAILSGSLIFTGCKDGNDNGTENADNTESQATEIKRPTFSADSAYAFIEKQLSFGPRVPGTPAQKIAATWMREKLSLLCDTVYVQNTEVKAGNGKMLPCINIIGAINPAATKRILLLAHWDSRPWADRDVENKDKAILAADDGASGVAVLIELARQIQSQRVSKNLGIDILLTDVEDYGKSEWGDDSYALGTQYWAKNPHVAGYNAMFGILLDMVGARNARFPLEGLSTQYASAVQQKVWKAASTAGYSSFFVYEQGPAITDDHAFVNEIIKIPTIDIINLSTNGSESFAPHWHTHNDNISIIDKTTLKAVGETLLQVIYETDQEHQNI